MNGQMSEIARWRIISELYRRHPGAFRVIETHPCSGQYDCLSLYEEKTFHHVADFNISGNMHVWKDGQSESLQWDRVVDDPQSTLDHVCDKLRLPSVNKLPPSTPTTLVYRFIATFLTHATLGIHEWQCRNGMFDTSGYGGGVVQDFAHFPLAQERLRIRIDQDRLDPAYRFWFIRKNGFPLICLETTGLVWVQDAPQAIDLMDLYNKNHRNIWLTVVSAAGFLMA